MTSPTCWLAQFTDTPCDGRLCRVHLIPKALMRREFRYGAILVDKRWLPAQNPALEIRKGQRWRLHRMEQDERPWVWGCGAGGQGHHSMLDHSRTLRVPRAAIPEAVEAFAQQFGLVWWLDREYGENGS